LDRGFKQLNPSDAVPTCKSAKSEGLKNLDSGSVGDAEAMGWLHHWQDVGFSQG